MEKYWPGALTIIFKKSAKTSPSVTCGLDTIGFRIPNDETALEILKKLVQLQLQALILVVNLL